MAYEEVTISRLGAGACHGGIIQQLKPANRLGTLDARGLSCDERCAQWRSVSRYSREYVIAQGFRRHGGGVAAALGPTHVWRGKSRVQWS